MEFKTTITKKGLELGVECRLDGSLWVKIENKSLGYMTYDKYNRKVPEKMRFIYKEGEALINKRLGTKGINGIGFEKEHIEIMEDLRAKTLKYVSDEAMRLVEEITTETVIDVYDFGRFISFNFKLVSNSTAITDLANKILIEKYNLESLKRSDLKSLKPTEVDYGDYSTTYTYQESIETLLSLIEKSAEEKAKNEEVKKEKEESITTFKTGTSNILIANILSGSTGLNLQEANYMIYYNNTFDYAKRVQSEDRIHRLGQNKNCHIIDIVGNCGIDDKIMESISKKESLSKSIRKRINSIKDNKEEIEKFKAEILKEF